MKLFNIITILLLTLSVSACKSSTDYVDITADVMDDKVRGAWAGKMIGVIYGRPMEFAANSAIYSDSIYWQPENIEKSLMEDDIYGQLNFMMTMERYGQDVSIDSLAKNFAYAEFALCHANLQGRKNYFDGIPAAELSLPCNSIHCEDIDFQIECDFIGFINPCMPQSSNALCEKVGAIMSAADGMYAGMFVSAMHTLAYELSNPKEIIEKALLAIPTESGYAQCIKDVLKAYEENPNDWQAAWELLNEKWAPYDICTPYLPFNIDAKLNGAYVVMGLLYGQRDWAKTMEITVRCGQDTDCNTATAAAVLGLIDGYKAIPEIYKSHLPQIADSCFIHTDYSYNKAVSQTLAFIKENIEKNGGSVDKGIYHIRRQLPEPAPYVKGFHGIEVSELVPVTDQSRWRMKGNWEDFVYGDGDDAPYKVATTPGDSCSIEFEGSGVAILGSWNTDGGRAQVSIDGQPIKTIDTYYVTEAGKFEGNRAYLFYQLDLQKGNHTLSLVNGSIANPKSSGNKIYIEKILVYK